MKIYLFCSGGMSTSLLVTKMRKAAEAKGMEHEIEAFAESTTGKLGPEADIVLLAPQIKFREAAIRKELAGKFIQCINMRDYGLINGENVLNDALKGYEEFSK
ncbi:PTS sugar transporter subunit IIB [Lacrimispora brassicae]